MLLKGLLFFQLLYVVDELHFKWQTGIPAVAPVNLLFLVVLLVMQTGGRDQIEVKKPILQKGILALYGGLSFAFLWAQVRSPGDFVSDVTYLKNAMFYPLYYFMYLRCKQDDKTTRWLIIWIMVIAAVAGLEALHEGINYGFDSYNPFKRASGPFAEDWHGANAAGVFFAMFMPMFVAFALFLKSKMWRLGAIAGIVLIVGGTLFTYSRQSYFICLLGAALLFIRRNLILAIGTGLVLVSLSGYLPDTVTQRVEETKTQSKKGGEEIDESTASRWEIWEGAMGMWANNPIGVGLDRFKKNIGDYSSHKGMDAHNFYVLTLAECGPQGLFCVIFMLYCCFKLARYLRDHVRSDDPESQALALGFTVTTISVVLGSVYGSRILNGAVMAPYWALCGLLERRVHLTPETKDGEQKAPREATLVERFPLAAHITHQR